MWYFSPRKARHAPSARRPHPPCRPRLEALADRCCPSSGALDPTFGSGGIVTTGLKNYGLSAAGVLLQPNGDIIAYGADYTTAGGSPALARYTPSGSLDTTFGRGGIVTTGKTGWLGDGGAALQSDGKIVGTDGHNMDRYNSDGSLDTNFGSKGVVNFPSNFVIYSLLIQPSNGDIVLGGTFSPPNTQLYEFALLRYTPSGTLDSTFGNGGEVVTNIAGADEVHSLALENGDIVAGGNITGGNSGTLYSWALARYTLNGSLDTTFGSGGTVTTPSWSRFDNTGNAFNYASITKLLVQPNGQIVAVGVGTTSTGKDDVWALARYNIDGSVDSTFGSGGVVTSSITGNDLANGAALQPNGQIVVVGGQTIGGLTAQHSYGGLFEVGVYNPNGSLDTSFGSGGFVTQATTYGATAAGVVIQPDGKIVVAGNVAMGNAQFGVVPEDFMLARYGPSAAQIGSFTASPSPVTSGSSTTLTASNIALADPSSTIAQVAFYYLDASGNQVVLGYGTQTSPGVWTFTFNVSLAAGSYTLYAQAEDSDGVFSDPLALTLTVQ